MSRVWIWTGAGGLLVGLLLGWWIGRPVALLPEPPAPPFWQADGSLVVERVDPKTQPTTPPHALPSGATEIRRVAVVVKPPRGVIFHGSAGDDLGTRESGIQNSAEKLSQKGQSTASPGSLPIVDSCECPPVQVDLSLVRMPDKSRRVVASSPTGQILSGVDVPIELESVPRIPRWTLSAIAVGDLEGIRPGALISRRIGPLVVGAGALSDPGLRRPGAIVQLGVTW